MSKRRKSNHRKPPQQRVKIGPGDARRTVVAGKDGSYLRVQLEYMTHSKDEPGLADRIVNQMYEAARMTDLRTIAQQRADEVRDGEILTPDGMFVVERFIQDGDELLILKGRPASLQDQATLEHRWGEKPEQKADRLADGAKRLAEAQRDQVASAFVNTAAPVGAPPS